MTTSFESSWFLLQVNKDRYSMRYFLSVWSQLLTILGSLNNWAFTVLDGDAAHAQRQSDLFEKSRNLERAHRIGVRSFWLLCLIDKFISRVEILLQTVITLFYRRLHTSVFLFLQLNPIFVPSKFHENWCHSGVFRNYNRQVLLPILQAN